MIGVSEAGALFLMIGLIVMVFPELLELPIVVKMKRG
jgi:hypothetical protein